MFIGIFLTIQSHEKKTHHRNEKGEIASENDHPMQAGHWWSRPWWGRRFLTWGTGPLTGPRPPGRNGDLLVVSNRATTLVIMHFERWGFHKKKRTAFLGSQMAMETQMGVWNLVLPLGILDPNGTSFWWSTFAAGGCSRNGINGGIRDRETIYHCRHSDMFGKLLKGSKNHSPLSLWECTFLIFMGVAIRLFLLWDNNLTILTHEINSLRIWANSPTKMRFYQQKWLNIMESWMWNGQWRWDCFIFSSNIWGICQRCSTCRNMSKLYGHLWAA